MYFIRCENRCVIRQLSSDFSARSVVLINLTVQKRLFFAICRKSHTKMHNFHVVQATGPHVYITVTLFIKIKNSAKSVMFDVCLMNRIM